MLTLACLSPFTVEQVHELAGTTDLDVRLVPEPPAPEQVQQAIVDADLVIGDMRHQHQIDRGSLAQMDRCQFIQQPAAGFDSIDAEAAAEYGIPVCNAAGFNADTVADWTLMGILNVVRNGATADAHMREGGWRAANPMTGHDLKALTVGIVGYGRIGREVGQRIRGFGSRVLVFDPVLETVDPAEARLVSLEQLIREADVVSLHVPLNTDTKGLIDRDRLAAMKPTAIVVNACRGPVIDESALVEALTHGQIGGAALDVFEHEPLAVDSPLRSLPNVFLNPHLAGGSEEARAHLMEAVSANLRRFLAHQTPLNVVNPSYQKGRRR